MPIESEPLSSHHCFCEIPNEELKPWVEKRYGDNRPTVELLHSTDDPRQKEIIAIVALLDVDEASMLRMMGNVNQTKKEGSAPNEQKGCRTYAKES